MYLRVYGRDVGERLVVLCLDIRLQPFDAGKLLCNLFGAHSDVLSITFELAQRLRKLRHAFPENTTFRRTYGYVVSNRGKETLQCFPLAVDTTVYIFHRSPALEPARVASDSSRVMIKGI